MKIWVTRGTKDGSKKLSEPFYASNPRYVEVHHEWRWELVKEPIEPSVLSQFEETT